MHINTKDQAYRLGVLSLPAVRNGSHLVETLKEQFVSCDWSSRKKRIPIRQTNGHRQRALPPGIERNPKQIGTCPE